MTGPIARGSGRSSSAASCSWRWGCSSSYGFFLQQPAWNELSRYDLVRALVEQGTVQIDSFHENTGDKAFKDGHYYSDKAPGRPSSASPRTRPTSG